MRKRGHGGGQSRKNVSDACWTSVRGTVSAADDRYGEVAVTLMLYTTSLSLTPAAKYINKINLNQEMKNKIYTSHSSQLFLF